MWWSLVKALVVNKQGAYGKVISNSEVERLRFPVTEGIKSIHKQADQRFSHSATLFYCWSLLNLSLMCLVSLSLRLTSDEGKSMNKGHNKLIAENRGRL
jgi:hypothetical protein